MRRSIRLVCLSAVLGIAACGSDTEGPTPSDGVCGNGVVEAGEQCDDGNTADGDGCSNACLLPVCGNGLVESGEECDDGDTDDTNDCSNSCVSNGGGGAVCGDGTLDVGEECDDGNTNAGDGCAADCTTESAAVCGDGTLDDGEECDDGNTDDGDGCAADCTNESACGDGNLDDGEECDDGEGNSDSDADACRTDCTAATCGDSVTDAGEDCDGGDDCNDDCTFGAFCGDGNVDDGEDCDDGDANSDEDADACRTDCTAAACGDDVTDAGEDCDGGEDCNDDCTTIPGCGNGFLDDGEECDDGINNSDLIPDACRSACTLPVCGDEVIDSGEECDLGDANGPEAECLDTCSVNLDLACAGVPEFVDLSVEGETTEDGIRYTGSTRELGADHEPGVGCVPDDAPTGSDIMFVFTADADGAFVVSTAGPGTVDDTVLYQVNNCSDQIPGVCNDNAGGSGSTIIIDDAVAGTQYFVVVDSVGTGGLFELTISSVVGVSGAGETCADGFICDAGLLCEADVCAADAAPVLVSLTSTTSETGDVTHIFAGTDENFDVDSWYISAVTFEDTTIDDGGIFPTGAPFVAWDGVNFEIELTINWVAFQGQAITDLTAYVTDARGNESNSLTATVPAYVPPATGLVEGDPCDLARIVDVCDDPFTCTVTDDGDVCAAAAAPVLDAASTERRAADAVRFFFDGTDTNGDVVLWGANFLDAEGELVFGPGEFAFEAVTIGLDTFGHYATITGLTTASGIAQAEVWLIDDAGLESERLIVEVPLPTVSGAAGPCDPEGVSAICEPGLVCSPDGAEWACAAPEAPVITLLEAEYVDLLTLEFIVFYVEGSDANADVVEADITVVDPDGGAGSLTLTTAQMTPDPTGRSVFAFTTIDVGTGGALFVDSTVVLRDSAGLESEPVSDPLGDEVGGGDPCTPDGTGGACTDGLVCGLLLTCEEALPPVLDVLSAIRINASEVQFVIEGSDPNGDVTGQSSSLLDDELAVVIGPLAFILDDSVTGLDTFTVTSTIGGFDVFPEATSVELALTDSADLSSELLTVAIPPLRAAGEECVGDGVTDLCADGTECVEGFCVGTPPILATATALQNEENSRLLDVTITGTDPDQDIVSVTIDFFDGEGVSIFGAEPLVVNAADLADPFGVDYVAGEFTFRLQFDWEAVDLYGVADASVSVTDSLDQTDGPLDFTFRPTVGLGTECDVEQVVAFCATGLVCDSEVLLCDVDPADRCGGIPIIDVATDGEFVAGEGIYVPFDSNGRENLAEADCGPFGASEGAEVAALWVAPANGELFVTTATEATGTFDTYIYARIGFCSDPASEVACNDDIGGGVFQSEIVFPVTLGDEVFVILDGFGAGGVGEALFVFEEQVALGESCETAVCVDGLFCNAATTCVEFTDVGGDCFEVPCVDGLTCDEGSLCQAPLAVGGDCSGVVPCEAGLTCDEANLCAAPIAIGGMCGGVVPCVEVAECDLDTFTCVEFATSCGTAAPIATDALTFSGSMLSALDDVAAPCGFNGAEIVFEWVSDTTGSVTIDTFDTSFDTILYVSEGVCGDVELAVCNDDLGGGVLQSAVTIEATAGTTYYFHTEQWGEAAPVGDVVGNITRL